MRDTIRCLSASTITAGLTFGLVLGATLAVSRRQYAHNDKRTQGGSDHAINHRCLSARAITAGLAFGLMLGVALVRAPQAQAQNFTLGYSTGFLQDPFQVIQADSVMASGKKAGLKTLPVANAANDAGKQITDFHNLISEGAQGILLVARDSDAIVPALNFAESKKVPVVAIDMGPAGGKAAMVVRADNIRMGADACALTGKALGGKGVVLSLMGDQATLNGRDRTSGFANCMKKDFPDIKVIEQPTYWQAEKATAIAQTIVTSTPDLGAIYMQSDAVMLPGVLNVLKSAGKLKKVGEPGHIFLVSIDGTPFAHAEDPRGSAGRRDLAAAGRCT